MKRVLVADDDDLVREMVATILEGAGYAVLVAADGLEAWKLLQEKGADMAVLDLNMPNKNGLELTQLIRNDTKYKEMPILMLSIRALVEDQVSGYQHGADDYLTKPFDKKMLIARLHLLERRILGNA